MIPEIKYISRKYDWGWSVWLQVGHAKTLLAVELRDEDAVNEFIKSMASFPVEQQQTERQKKEKISLGCL